MIHMDSELMLSDMESSMDTMPGTPLSKCVDMEDQGDSNPPPCSPAVGMIGRRERRIKTETILSRVSSFASLNEVVSLDDICEYDWADSDSESPSGKHSKESYIVQEMLADFLKIKSFKRKYPDLSRRAMDAYERSWLHQEGLVPAGRAELGLTAIRTDDVMRLLQSDYPEVHTALTDLFRRRRFEQAAQLQKRQYEAARIERGGARAEAARRRALDSVTDFNHHLVNERLTNRRCYWDLQTMQIHVPTKCYKLMESRPYPHGAYPVAVIPGQFAEHFEKYTPEQLKHLPLSRSLFTQPCRNPPKPPPPLPTNLRFGSVQPRPIPVPVPVCNGVQENAEKSREQESLSVVENGLNKSDDVSGRNVEPLNGQRLGRPAGSSSPITTPILDQAPKKHSPDNEDQGVDGEQEQCRICKQPTDVFIKCSECGHTGHPKCLDISDSMLPGVRSYSWVCMECKRCTECLDSGHEEDMMFCDRCDRGYHAFCVGLDGIPDGRWECPLCTDRPMPKNVAKSSRKSKKRSLGSPSSDSDFEPSKPKRKYKKKPKLDGAKVRKSTSNRTKCDADNGDATSPIKRKRGRPRLTDEERLARKLAKSESLKKVEVKSDESIISPPSSNAEADDPQIEDPKSPPPEEENTAN